MIIPAILTNNKTDLVNKITALEKLEIIKWVQVDIMDNKFIPYKSINIDELKDIKTNLLLEAHLMVLNPQIYYTSLQHSAFKRIIFHIEATSDAKKNIEIARQYGFKVGVALNPETNFNEIKSVINLVDMVLFLGVRPGQQGQAFIKSVLEKIKNVRRAYPDLIISLDGGINKSNISEIYKSGANHVVVGSAIWENNQPLKNYLELQNTI